MRKTCTLLILAMLLVYCGEQVQLSNSLDAVGISGEMLTENFAANTNASDKLDILLVIDGSESMREERAKIARKLIPLLAHIEERDWQIGIVSTDMTSCFAAVVNANTPDYQDVYRQAIDAIKEANAEQAVYMTIRALKGMPVMANNTCDDDNPQYLLRDDSALGIIIVTDEDHQCLLNLGCELQDLYDFLSLIRLPNITAKVYGFLNADKNTKFLQWRDEGGETIFTRHEPYNTGDYDAVLKNVSRELSTIVQYKYKLKKQHDNEASHVVITFAGEKTKSLNPNEYGIIGKKLYILTTLPHDARAIKVSYSYQP